MADNIDKLEKQLKFLIEKLFQEDNEEEQANISLQIQNISPDPYIIDYIFHSEDYIDDNGNVDISKLLKKVFQYKPILL